MTDISELAAELRAGGQLAPHMPRTIAGVCALADPPDALTAIHAVARR